MIRPKDDSIQLSGLFNEDYTGILNAIYKYHEGKLLSWYYNL
jgi:hypothetical protein